MTFWKLDLRWIGLVAKEYCAVPKISILLPQKGLKLPGGGGFHKAK